MSGSKRILDEIIDDRLALEAKYPRVFARRKLKGIRFDDDVDDANLAPEKKKNFDGTKCIHCEATAGFYDERGFTFCNVCNWSQSLYSSMTQAQERRNFEDGPDHRRTEREPEEGHCATSVPANLQFASHTAFHFASNAKTKATSNEQRFRTAINTLADHIGDEMFRDVRQLALTYASELSKAMVQHNSLCKATKCRLCYNKPNPMIMAAALLFIAKNELVGHSRFGYQQMAVYLQGVGINKDAGYVHKHVSATHDLLSGASEGSYVCGAGKTAPVLGTSAPAPPLDAAEAKEREVQAFLDKYTPVLIPLVETFKLPYRVRVRAIEILKYWHGLDIVDSNTTNTVVVAAVWNAVKLIVASAPLPAKECTDLELAELAKPFDLKPGTIERYLKPRVMRA